MLDYDTSKLEKTSRELHKAFENHLIWKWDDRFETVLAEFDAGNQDSIIAIIKTHMGDIWDGGNFQKAPEIIKIVIKFFGGLHPGQELFTTQTDRDDLLLCAWWPWSNGKTISIRLGVFARSLSDEKNKELTQMFKGWFGL
ncbi:MAG: hypothetical protein ABIJ31_05615 [Pseudomonadota bacterium]